MVISVDKLSELKVQGYNLNIVQCEECILQHWKWNNYNLQINKLKLSNEQKKIKQTHRKQTIKTIQHWSHILFYNKWTNIK